MLAEIKIFDVLYDLIVKKEEVMKTDKLINIICKLNQEEIKEDNSELKDIILNNIAEIIKSYIPDGIGSIINENHVTREDDVSIVLILNSTKEFEDKFLNNNPKQSSSNTSITYRLTYTSQKKEEKVATTLKYREMLKQIFEDFDKYDEELLELVINKHALDNTKKFKLDYKPEELGALPYYEFSYEDFLLIFIRMILYFTKFKVEIELLEDKKIYLKFWGDESVLEKWASIFRYELQVRPYAMKFSKYLTELQAIETERRKDENEALLHAREQASENNNPTLQFYQLNESSPMHWPPYMIYEKDKNIKYRRYTKDDNNHECKVDVEFDNVNDFEEQATDNCCSKFRNIDKLRLLKRSLDNYVKFNALHLYEVLDTIAYKRNHVSYFKLISNNSILCKPINIFNSREQNKLITTIRNFFGERVSFYYLWNVYYMLWMVFPVILGIILGVLTLTLGDYFKSQKFKTFQEFTLSYYEIVLFSFTVLMTIWATLFIKIWQQKESLYNYLWGMENYAINEPYHESFVPSQRIPFIFDQTLPIQSKCLKFFKMSISYIVLLVLICVDVVIVYFLFRWKAHMTDNYKDTSFKWPIIIASINGVQIRVMSVIYEFIARRLTQWENHEKFYSYENSLAIKIIMFEFLNNYVSIYYAAFVKPFLYEYCIDKNCIKETEVQLYILLLTRFLFFIIDIIYGFIKRAWRRSNVHLIKRGELDVSAQSLQHQVICDEKTTLIFEYNEVVILFGYVCLFAVAAPFAPVIIFTLLYFKKMFDGYKMINFERVQLIEGASGIEIYNSVLKVFYFVGMITNIGIILFTSPALLNVSEYFESKLINNNDFIVKFIIFAIVENFVIFLMLFLDIDTLPDWFEHLPIIKSLYIKKYFSRLTEALPHKNIDKGNKFMNLFKDHNINKEDSILYLKSED